MVAADSGCGGGVLRKVLAMTVVLVVLSGSVMAASRHRPVRRAVSDTSSLDEMAVIRTCQGNTPCRWEVYIPSSRKLDYVMNNTCECPSDKLCVLTEDDLSVSAYVHRCRSPQIS